MSIVRDDRWVADAQGRALAGAQVYWCLQPASTASNPPSPLATIYTDATGDTPETQPVITDGFGHAWTYLDDTLTYTIVIWHPLFGPNPVVLPDQTIGGGGGGGSSSIPFSGALLPNPPDGVTTSFQLANGSGPLGVAPLQATVWRNFPLIPGIGYSLVGFTVTFPTAPAPTENLYAQGWYIP
jgi:hypothetical protein